MDNVKENTISHITNDVIELSEKDFYPPQDTRELKSGVTDINGGDTFLEYTEYLFEMCDELLDE